MTFQSSMRIAKTLSMLACCAALFALQAKAAPSAVAATDGVIGYLERFGYLPPPSPHFAKLRTEESLFGAISDFQSYMGINVTGIADDETIRVMEAPRCGLPDKAAPSTGGRSKRYAFLGEPWQNQVITYRVSQYTNQLNPNDVDRVIADTFAIWAEHVPLRFERSSSRQVDMDIRFVRRSHGDNNPFDGPGHTVAHAFAPGPGIGGDVHFDDDEHWTIGGNYGTELSWVALHEIGHALGLDHSNVKTAIMWPTYRPNAAVRLDQDDIDGIKARYSGGSGLNTGPVIHRIPWIRIKPLYPLHWPGFPYSG